MRKYDKGIENNDIGLFAPSKLRNDIVACQAHPGLVKIGLILARIFHFNSLLVCVGLVYGLKG